MTDDDRPLFARTLTDSVGMRDLLLVAGFLGHELSGDADRVMGLLGLAEDDAAIPPAGFADGDDDLPATSLG